MELPPPLSSKAFQAHTKAIHEAVVAEAHASICQAVQNIRDRNSTPHDHTMDISVSCDATWARRGFSSLHGVVIVISLDTGQVLDYEVLSRKCSTCQRKALQNPNVESQEFQEWFENHLPDCQANFDGSAPSMEAAGAEIIWNHSLQKHNCRYTKLLGDGDSKTHERLVSMKPYGDSYSIEKLECVGHVQKRLGKQLLNLKTSMKGRKLRDGKPLSGKGRLTKVRIDSWQNYYGSAIRNNKGDLNGMQNAVWAILYHDASSDQKPQHQYCPVGPQSWCGWQRDVANGTTKYRHHDTVPEAIVEVVKPIFKKLSDSNLLKRCLHGGTQNQNESFNNLVWLYCPKTGHAERRVIETAVGLAICHFNNGMSAVERIMQRLVLSPGPLLRQMCSELDKKRMWQARYKCSQKKKKKRKKRRAKKKGFEDKKTEEEGVTYDPGGF